MILLLGGTGEARALAALLVEEERAVVSSLAGRVQRPRLPVGSVRIGGFGGVDGLRAYLRSEGIEMVVDATHPFAAGISTNAVRACGAEGIPLLRLERPGWADEPGADAWHWVDSHDEAATVASGLGQRPFLTVGRQSLGRFTEALAEHAVLVRVVDPPDLALPQTWTVLESRGPYVAEAERALMVEHGVDVLITKDSGGRHTRAKVEVASDLGIAVIVVRRPSPPDGVEAVGDAAAVLDRLVRR